MKAKKFLSSALKFVLLAVVGAFLALHSINLFSFVFPAEQQYLAWLGFGLTGFGAVVYLVMFLWEGGTTLQKSVSLAMAVICSIGEVLAAIFGMMIESWTKAGFALTENDFQSMLLVIGALSIAHFFALITYFAGDKVGDLFMDRDGDGIPDAVDPIDNRTGQPFARGAVLTKAADVYGFYRGDPVSEAEAKELIKSGIIDNTDKGNGHKAAADPQSRRS